MEFTNHKIIKSFISKEESKTIIEWVDNINHSHNCKNHHINTIRKNLNGYSYMYDISKTEQTKDITTFQSGNDVIQSELPDIFHYISKKISSTINIPYQNVFLQILDMDKGGKINPHYDAAMDGYINYKCNVSVLSHDYNFVIEKDIFNIQQSDLYCFEASLYKHWSEKEFNTRRILLSYGFILPYEYLNRSESDYRVRLSKRIIKMFQ